MKRSLILRTSFAAFAALAVTANCAFAGESVSVNFAEHKLNYKPINPHDQGAVGACVGGGGTVGKNPQGQDACITKHKADLASHAGSLPKVH